ncbi:class I SAM-dependent methyltransferase [Virgibacillus salexigens]|uniref:class I SAM-dependent methyltransferase n=1 Tax=Virgibacillus salexigens TaxID=61016 RepID=UPI0019096BEC|nr:class I SAM-dependent methyltransferase [Virgibacillus salexigens]
MSISSFNYDQAGETYGRSRQTDPRMAAYVERAIGEAQTIINVGAGAGSYEPKDKYVMAVEPSKTMRLQRKEKGRPPAVIGRAEALPFDDRSFDAAMAMVTIHHWQDMERGIQELRRVSKGPVAILTFDPDALHEFWNMAYFPEVVEAERKRYPTMEWLTTTLGGSCQIEAVPIPLDCLDGFQEAFYGRPEAFLNPEVRRNQSAWGFVSEETASKGVTKLEADLQSGKWDKRYGHYRRQPFFVGALRLLVSTPDH